MKIAGWLKLSLALNLALGAAWFAVASRTMTAAPARTPPDKAAVAPLAAVAAPDSAAPLAEVVPPPAGKFDWSRVASADFRQYTANLRGIHCPERLVREIVVAEIQKFYDDRQSALSHELAAFDPWTGQDIRAAAGRKQAAQSTALGLEQLALIKELFGAEWNPKAGEIRKEEEITGVLLGFLTDDKTMQTVAVAMNCEEQSREIRRQADGILIAEDFAALRRVGEEEITRLGAVLTPVELDELRNRVQLIGMDMDGVHLDGVPLSGAELRKIAGYAIGLKDFLRERLVSAEDLTAEEEARRRTNFDQQVASLLDPQRYADYQRAQDGDFRAAYGFTRQHSLPVSTAAMLADAVRSADAQAEEIRADQALSAEEKKLSLQVLQIATRDRISTALGPAFTDYEKDNGAGLRYVPPEPPKGGAP